MRIGHGYDVHRLTPGRPLVLGGVEIPWDQGLEGHSDAEVLTHAVMDALLDAAALGDIGFHLSVTDDCFKNICCQILLRRVCDMVRRVGFEIGNLDVTVVAQRPKLMPYVEQMRKVLSATMGIRLGQINIKATTEERLGFTGRSEGIAAHCVCLLETAEQA